MIFIDSFGKKEQSMEEMIRIYNEAKEWLESKGINVNPTRFQKNLKLIKSNNIDSIKKEFDFLWANSELHDLCEIYLHLSKINSKKLTDSLKTVVSGPELLQQEKNDGGSIHGRNFTFELYSAARIARCGYGVTFDTDADINFINENRLYHVECKRVVSENNMDTLIDKAIKQIDKRCANNSNDRGIVSLSVTKLVAKAIDLEAKGVHANIDDMQDTMRKLVAKWGQLIQHHYSKKSIKTLGLILHYKMPLRDKETGAATFLNRFSMIHFNNGYENNLLAHDFSEKLRLSIEGTS